MAKLQIRNEVFETNSSSVHSLTMCSEEEYNKWKEGELFLIGGGGYEFNGDSRFVSKDEADIINAQIMSDNDVNNWEDLGYYGKEDSAQTYDEWWDYYSEYESFEEHKNIGGTDVVAFGWYGHD